MKPIDYKHWFNLDYWTFEQAAYLFSNINPNDENHIAFLNSHKSWTASGSSPLYPEPHYSTRRFTEYLQVLENTDLSTYEGSKNLNNKALVSDIFELAINKKLNINSNLLRAWGRSDNNPNKPITTAAKVAEASNEGYFGKETIDAFDALKLSGIAKLFSSISPSWDTEKWKIMAHKAKENRLIEARETVTGGRAESTFNPVRVANWLIADHGSLPEHIERKLRKNMPDRSKDQEEDVFGID